MQYMRTAEIMQKPIYIEYAKPGDPKIPKFPNFFRHISHCFPTLCPKTSISAKFERIDQVVFEIKLKLKRTDKFSWVAYKSLASLKKLFTRSAWCAGYTSSKSSEVLISHPKKPFVRVLMILFWKPREEFLWNFPATVKLVRRVKEKCQVWWNKSGSFRNFPDARVCIHLYKVSTYFLQFTLLAAQFWCLSPLTTHSLVIFETFYQVTCILKSFSIVCQYSYFPLLNEPHTPPMTCMHHECVFGLGSKSYYGRSKCSTLSCQKLVRKNLEVKHAKLGDKVRCRVKRTEKPACYHSLVSPTVPT